MKLVISILIIFCSFTINAQNPDTIKIPAPVAKEIAKDLIKGDSAKAELTLTKSQLNLTEEKVKLKDDIISIHTQKDSLYERSIKNEQSKFDVQGMFVEQLRKDNKRLKSSKTFTQIIAGAIIGLLGYLYITK